MTQKTQGYIVDLELLGFMLKDSEIVEKGLLLSIFWKLGSSFK